MRSLMVEQTSVHSQFQAIGNLRHDVRPLAIEPSQRKNLRRLFVGQLYRIRTWGAVAIGTVAIEALVPLAYHSLIKRNYRGWGQHETLIFGAAMLLAVIFFAGMRWLEIYLEKLVTVELLNRLRRAWYREYLRRDLRESVASRLLPKVTYHFGLLQMGLRGSLFMSVKWSAAAATLLLASLFIGHQLFLLTLAGLGLCIAVAGASFFVARNLVSQDKTLYSRMLREMVASLEDVEVHRRLDTRPQLLRRFDRIVELDTFFRVRREMWVRLGGLFIAVAIMAIFPLALLVEAYRPEWLAAISATAMTSGLFVAVLVRLLHMSVSIGMFGFPLYLGLALTVPNFPMNRTAPRWDKIRSLSFRSKSVRPTRDGKRQDVELDVQSGDRLNVRAGAQGRDFTRLLTGRYASREGKPWVVVHNGERFSYNTWKKGVAGIWHVSPLFTTRLPVIALLTGCCEDEVDAHRLTEVLSRLDGLPHLEELGIEAAHIRSPTIPEMRGWDWMMAVQVVAVLTRRPELIVIDEVLLRTTNPVLRDLLAEIPKRCDDSIVVAINDEEGLITKERHYALVA